MKNLVALASSSYKTAVPQTAIYWFKGNWAMATGCGYPITGAWGPGDSALSGWTYFGGDFPSPSANPTFRFSGSVKSTGNIVAIAAYAGFQTPKEIIMAGAVDKPRFVKSKFSSNYQSSYMTATYAHYSEAGRLWQQASWRARAVFLFDTAGIFFNPVTFAVNPSVAYSIVVDPVTLATGRLYGSVTYGTSEYKNFLHSNDAVLQVTHNRIGCPCVKGEIIYIPLPSKQAGQYYVWVPPNPSQDYVLPQLSADGRKLFYGYSSMFVAVLSYSLITPGTVFNVSTRQYKEFSMFYNIYGSQDGSIIDNNVSAISIGLAMETASPQSFPGSNLGERFQAFIAKYDTLQVPQLVAVNAKGEPTFSYISAAGVTMTLAWKLGTTGTAYLSKPGEATGTLVDYANWPTVYEEVNTGDSASSGVWVNTVNGAPVLTPKDFPMSSAVALVPMTG